MDAVTGDGESSGSSSSGSGWRVEKDGVREEYLDCVREADFEGARDCRDVDCDRERGISGSDGSSSSNEIGSSSSSSNRLGISNPFGENPDGFLDPGIAVDALREFSDALLGAWGTEDIEFWVRLVDGAVLGLPGLEEEDLRDRICFQFGPR